MSESKKLKWAENIAPSAVSLLHEIKEMDIPEDVKKKIEDFLNSIDEVSFL